MGSGEQMLLLERDARLRFEASCSPTQSTCAQNSETSCTQTSLVTYYDEGEEEEEDKKFHIEEPATECTAMASSSASCWQRDASSWQQDGYWQQCGLKVRRGCPANCEVCRFGAHL